MTKYLWEVQVNYTWKGEYNLKEDSYNIVASNILTVCAIANKIIQKDFLKGKKTGGKSEKNLPEIIFVKRLQKINK